MITEKSIFRSVVMASVIGLMGCNTQPSKPDGQKLSTTASGTGGKVAEKLAPLEIQLNWKPEAEHGGYYAALVHGYFAEEGLDVTLTPGGPGTPLMESVATNRIPFGVDNADKLIRARAEEADVVAVFAPIQDSPRCILVHEESGTRRLADLGDAEGMTLAWNSSQPFAQFLSKKLDLSRLQMTKYSGVGPFLLDKKYAMQAYSISEPFVAKQQGAMPVVLMLSEMGFNTYTSLLLTNPQLLKDQPELVRKVIRASQRGWGKYLTDAVETNRRIAELNPEMPADVLAFGAAELQQLCHFGEKWRGYGVQAVGENIGNASTESHIGWMSAHDWQVLIGQLEAIDMIKPSSVTAESAFTSEFLPAVK